MSDLYCIRNTRKKQGLKGFQLAERMQVSPARISMLEKDESRGAVTLKMMERAAKALGCKFEYRIVPLAENVMGNTAEGTIIGKPRYRLVQK